jgi:hypothetical protein
MWIEKKKYNIIKYILTRLYIVRLIRRIYVMSGYMSLSSVTFFVPLEEINGYVASWWGKATLAVPARVST